MWHVEFPGHGTRPLEAAARDGRNLATRDQAQRGELDPAAEAGADHADPDAHKWDRQETVSVPTGTASTVTSAVTRPAAATAIPAPRTVSVTAGCTALTVTSPESSATPWAICPTTNRTPTVAPRVETVSPRWRRGQVPVVSESVLRSQTSAPLPPLDPRTRTPRQIPPAHRLASGGTVKRTVSFGARTTKARNTAAPCGAGALPHAAPSTATATTACLFRTGQPPAAARRRAVPALRRSLVCGGRGP